MNPKKIKNVTINASFNSENEVAKKNMDVIVDFFLYI